MRLARLAFATAASAWVLLVLAAPVTAAGAPASAVAYALGSLICHQRPERSFYLGTAQLPVCARCFGLYFGAALGAIATFTIAGLKPCARPTMWRSQSKGVSRTLADGIRCSRADGMWRSRSGLRVILAAAALPTALTWGLEFAGVWPFGNASRFVAALPLGAAVALTVNYVECAQPRPIGPRPPRIRT